MTATAAKLRLLNRISLAVLLFWSGTLSCLLWWAIANEEDHALHYARLEARANFNKDMSLRNWISKRGGIYVPVSKDTPPNPYLAHMSERDIQTASGKQLTLMNATYMLRQTMNEFSALYGIRGRITSLTPLNPDNAPDGWETAVLKQFAGGVQQEVSEVAEIGGKPYLRYMQVVYAEDSCLSCHFQQQVWKKGNVRGGIGISVPLEPYLSLERHTSRLLMCSYGLLWLLGASGVLVVNRFARRQTLRQDNTEAELERLNAVLSRQARHDELTQVYNRRAFNQRLCEEWQQWQRKSTVFSVLLADIDFFKRYNDTYGHLMGDSCLRAVAEALQKIATRPGDLIARFGGEEFVMLLPGTDLSPAMAVAERARQAVEQLAIPHSSSDCAKVVTLSIGAAASVQAAAKCSCHDLIDLADKALYEAKNNGRNRIESLPSLRHD
ncbi:diguanylate cyclase [Candidatus Electronema sp. PJ]|uniref:diguanylate cyclase n=1 Tax=Candidatus Electronema sp. PJ TaxID=3401572 RepID=UPI003AA913E8